METQKLIRSMYSILRNMVNSVCPDAWYQLYQGSQAPQRENLAYFYDINSIDTIYYNQCL